MRISAKDDIVSKCGNPNNEEECSYYIKSSHRSSCVYRRFGFICDRFIINPIKEG